MGKFTTGILFTEKTVLEDDVEMGVSDLNQGSKHKRLSDSYPYASLQANSTLTINLL
jgi:hypothetical protein